MSLSLPRIEAPPTERQLQVLAIIQSNIAQRGFPPTLREMGEALGVTNNTISGSVVALVRRGMLTVQPRIARSFVITEAGFAALGDR